MDVEAVPLLAIHHGLVALRARPQVFCRFESVTGASPGTSEASAVTLKSWPGGAAGAAPTISRAVAIAAASAARTKRCMGTPLFFVQADIRSPEPTGFRRGLGASCPSLIAVGRL